MKRLPIVAIIGQTNAGKSSLLNRLARRRIAIVAREAGTTRDNVSAIINDQFLLIDTAGLKDPEDDFEAQIQDQIEDAITSADLILLALDSSKSPDQKDKRIAKQALKSKKPVLLVLNKSDLKDSLSSTDFLSLGIKPDHTFRTSATTGQGTADLMGAISKHSAKANVTAPASNARTVSPANMSREGSYPSESEPPVKTGRRAGSPEEPLRIALIGRPNVGKSSLLNGLAKKQQALVSSRQGTTRDINRVQLKYKGQLLEILDTAGLRKPGKREVGIEKFSALRTLAAIEEADICALLVDATEPHAKLDQSLAGQIVKSGKGIIVVLTKTDLIQDHSTIDQIISNLERDFNFIPYAPLLLTSAKTGKNLTQLFELAQQIQQNRHKTLKTSDLNKILKAALSEHPPAGLKNTHPKPKYIVQTDTAPPWFVIHGHDLELIHWSYTRFLERKIREFEPFVGTPINLSFTNDK